ncbi:type II toxin-antitoxin system RelE family toxin [Hippea alviniae]|uniref:type II toxin-antitoxin system RelE family toxin n=1 Tax=Hippea alviniae TaxID=1279027 RepID=UPI0003B39760|nr:hypothetical protein [Hippea alviniae]
MISKTTSEFWKLYEKLPDELKKEAKKAFTLFQENPFYPSLRFKKIYSKEPIYSIRITKDYRAVGVKKSEEIIWFWIGKHSDYEKLISS